MDVSNRILSDITVYMKYAKYIPELNRRETWYELVTRNKNMHINENTNLFGHLWCPQFLFYSFVLFLFLVGCLFEKLS